MKNNRTALEQLRLEWEVQLERIMTCEDAGVIAALLACGIEYLDPDLDNAVKLLPVLELFHILHKLQMMDGITSEMIATSHDRKKSSGCNTGD